MNDFSFINLQWVINQTSKILVLPKFYQSFTKVLPRFYQGFTKVLPRFYQGFTKGLPRLRLLNVIDVDFESVFLVVDGVEEPFDSQVDPFLEN